MLSEKNEQLIEAVTSLRQTLEAKKIAEQVQQISVQVLKPLINFSL